ncbi:hypothetical protein [Nocardioides sp. TF02-7]|uniref:hypothetical protein n=1 Tax=Nocardioides sp. TF02-7 TaxID=2917724 RepID=UPI001F0508BE|nr:hypothetical protein [Nocardioides sp. TF02-7]UMG91322.1 hypothetical protein MF408_14240 [Nocardioides sp. TF02-7]
MAAVLPVAALLSSCGFDYPTDRVNLIGAGAHDRSAKVDVLGARVVAAEPGQGRLIGTLVNNYYGDEEPIELAAVEGNGLSVELTDVAVAPNEKLNLSGDDAEPVVVTGDFTAGDFVTLTFTFTTDESVSLDVPVVKHCGQYADIELPASAGESGDAAAETASEETEEADATYLCDHPTEAPEDGGH